MTENTLKLKWAEPSDNGGCLIKQYVVEKREASKRAWQREGVATDTEYQVIALTTGTPYLFQVAAENEVGVGPFVELSKPVSPRSQFDPPGPPSAPTASDVTKDSCALTWRAPESDGGTEIIGYQVERCLGQSNRWIRITKDPVPGLTFDVKELIEDNVYEFRVYAVNKVGDGPAGPSSEPVTARDPWGTSVICA